MIVVTAAPTPSLSRRRAAAALAAVAVGAAALLITAQSGAAAAPVSPPAPAAVPVAAAAPVTTTAGKVSLSVDPAGGLSTAGATLKVSGNGFDPGTGLYVAICHADGKAPTSLKDCVGGAIPKSNTSRSWAHISDGGQQPGESVAAKWGPGGSFGVELVLPPSDSASDALDCAKVPCAVYTTVDTGQNKAENLSVPLVYAAPATTSSAPTSTAAASSTAASTIASSTPASSTAPSSTAPSSTPSSIASSSPQFSTSSAVVATTVQAKSVRFPTVVAGTAQEVLFAGFAPNEPVTVTLYSAPQPLPAARADQDGVVKVDFTVPADLEPATHLLRVVGQTSKVTGVASFVVTAPVVSSSAIAVVSTPVSSSAVSSSPPASSALPVPATLTSASVASSAPVSSAVAPVVPPASSGGRTTWPWYLLAVLLAVILGTVAYLLSRRAKLAAERRENDALLADAAAAEHERNLDAIARANADAPTAYLGGAGPEVLPPSGYTGYHPGEHGLLSGRDHPDNPGLLSGTGYRGQPPVDPPTTFLPGDDRTTALPADRTTALPGDGATALPDDRTTALPQDGTTALPGDRTTAVPGGPPTGAWRPDFDDPAGGPPTGTWRPDFDDDNPSVGPRPDGLNERRDGSTGEQPDDQDPDGRSGGRHSRPS